MEEIFNFIEDLQKRLSRPIKDLDDIRFAMASLKDIRENEIRIDMCIGPIEVSTRNELRTGKEVNTQRGVGTGGKHWKRDRN